MLVIVWPLVRHSQSLPARNDRHPVDGIRARHQQPTQRVTTLVVRDVFALFRAERQRATPGSRSPTWRVSTKPRRSSSKLSTF